jgi:hypothetical protein
MTHRLLSTAALAVLLLVGSVPAEEPLKSGPPVGARNNRGGFYPNFVAGPFAGEDRCPV